MAVAPMYSYYDLTVTLILDLEEPVEGHSGGVHGRG